MLGLYAFCLSADIPFVKALIFLLTDQVMFGVQIQPRLNRDSDTEFKASICISDKQIRSWNLSDCICSNTLKRKNCLFCFWQKPYRKIILYYLHFFFNITKRENNTGSNSFRSDPDSIFAGSASGLLGGFDQEPFFPRGSNSFILSSKCWIRIR